MSRHIHVSQNSPSVPRSFYLIKFSNLGIPDSLIVKLFQIKHFFLTNKQDKYQLHSSDSSESLTVVLLSFTSH